MFGRSGQMFPSRARNRAFHDAIYEEEYGSEQGDDCCQSRGLSAIFCWFLSVIILVGLAASVVLTAFFLLKGKTYPTRNGELDLLFEGENNISLNFPDATKEFSIGSSEENGKGGRGSGSRSSAETTTTRFPPSRRVPPHLFQQSSEEDKSSIPYQNLYPNGRFSSSERNGLMGKTSTPSTTMGPRKETHEQATDESSSSEEDEKSNHQMVFTAPPSSTTAGTRRGSHIPTERTSFTESTPSSNGRNEGAESQFNKVLFDQIPPHNQKSSDFNLPSTTDPLAKMIRNFGPKWGRNRTVETTTMSSGTHKYNFTISSREKNKGKESEEMGGNASDKSKPQEVRDGMQTVVGPDLTKQGGEDGDIDILIGSEDQKTLVTKETEGGIVTSAILPPWYDIGSNNNLTILTTNATNSDEEESKESSSEEKPQKDSASSESTSVLGGLLHFFKNLPMRGTTTNHHQQHKETQEENFNPKRIVLKRPSGNLLLPPGDRNLNDKRPEPERSTSTVAATIHTVLPSNIMTTTLSPDDIKAANPIFHYGSSDGVTNIYGYYPDDEKDNDKTVEHHLIQSESILDPNQLVGSKSTENNSKNNPSHSIELEINPDASSEVVIEQDQGQEEEDGNNEDDEYAYVRYGEAHAGSEIRKHVVPAPPAVPTQQYGHGGGIRWPINNGESTDLEMKGSENRPLFANIHRNIPHQLIRQRAPLFNASKSSKKHNSVGTTNTTTPIAIVTPTSSSSSENSKEVVKTSTTDKEQQGSQNFLRKRLTNYRNKVQTYGAGTKQVDKKEVPVTAAGSLEQDGADSHQAVHSGSTERIRQWSRPDPNSTSHESLEKGQGGSQKPIPTTATSGLMHVKPSDPKLNENHSGSLENKNVFHVFPVGYTSTTTKRPTSDLSISQPEKSEENASSFVPPTPVNFHENLYTFSPGSAKTVYQSKDGWRPITYDTGEEDTTGASSAPGLPPPPTPTKAAHLLHWRERLQGMIRRPVATNSPIRFDLSTAASENIIVTPQQVPQGQEDQRQEEAESNELNKGEDNQQAANGNIQQHGNINFPQSNSQEGQNQPQFQRVPIQIQHQVPQQQQQQQYQHQHFQQLPQNFHFMHNNPANIDRSKYMMRPAPPPIMMRRTPAMTYMQQNQLPPRPQLIPHVQQMPQPVQIPQHSLQQNPLQHQLQIHPDMSVSPQNYLMRRRFKTLGRARPRSSSWEGEGQEGDEENSKLENTQRQGG